MYKQNCCNFTTSLIVSIIVGIGVSVVFSLGFLASIVTALWIAFGFSVLSVVALLVLAPLSSMNKSMALRKCLCYYGKPLVIGSIGTLIASLIALTLILSIASAVSIIVMFFVGTLFSLLLISIVQFILCIINYDCCEPCSHCC